MKILTYKMSLTIEGEDPSFTRVSQTDESGIFQNCKAFYTGEWRAGQLHGKWLRWKKPDEKVKRTIKPRKGYSEQVIQEGRLRLTFGLMGI